MPYIGKSPVGGGFHKLDALTASATATYALTLGGAAYYPETANQLLVSLNGVIQAPQDSFTVSGSNLIFDSALTASDSIDFVVALGDVLGVQGVTDGAVTTAKIGNDAVTKAKIGTTELDLSTIKDGTGTNTAMTIDSSGVITSSAGFANSASANFTAGSPRIVPTANGIPSWANEITIAFYNLSCAGTAAFYFAGYANGSEYTTNYEYMAMYAENGGNTTSDRSAGADGGFSFYPWTAPANFLSGTVTLTRTTGYEYVAWGHAYIDNQPSYFITLQGRVSFPSAMTGIQIYNSTNFDSGQVRVLWR